MNSDGSVTHWIHEIRDGDSVAAQKLWERYFLRLVNRARIELRATNRRVSDEEDVAVSVFDKFFRASQDGRFPDLADRDSLWRLLVRMTAQKAVDHTRRQSRQRRGGGRLRGESRLAASDDVNALSLVIGNEPTPEFCLMVTEQFDALLDLLGDEELRELALGKMEGYTNQEMAARLNCSLRTVERRLRLIRVKCKEHFQTEE